MNEIFISKPILWCINSVKNDLNMNSLSKLKSQFNTNEPFICDLDEICNPNPEHDVEVFASNGFK